MNDVLLKGMAKTLKPMLNPAARRGEKELCEYLQGIELQPGETGAVVVLDFDEDNNIVILIAAVAGLNITRRIAQYTRENIVDSLLKYI